MMTEEEIQNFFFSQWLILYFLGNRKQNFSFMANPTTPKYSVKKIALKHA